MICSSVFAMGNPPEKEEAVPANKQVEKSETDATTQASEYAEETKTEEIKPLLQGKTILIIIAGKDFRDEEYSVLRKTFEEHRAKVVIASSNKEKAIGVKRKEVTPDILLKEVKTKDYNAIVFIGGPGAAEYFDNSTAHSIAAWGFASRKTVAAICTAPIILANSGILGGKKATVREEESDKLIDEGAIYTGAEVEVFGNIITANGPKASEKFAKAIVDALSK